MKKLLSIYTVGLLLLITASCNKKLDVLPQNNVTPDQIATSADVQALIGGAYKQLQGFGLYGLDIQLVADLIADSDQVNWVGTFADYRDIQKKREVTTNFVAADMWGYGYKVIDIANTIIDKINLVDTASQGSVKATALFLRGSTYFELVNFYGKPYSDGNASTNLGLALLTAPVYVYDSLLDKPSRSTVSDTYKQAINDLTAAAALQVGSTDLYKTEAFLARVYLNMGDYPNAALMADDVIMNSGSVLSSSFDKEFNNASATSEDIFYIDQTSQSSTGGSGGLNTFYAANFGQPPSVPSGRGDAQVDPNYYTYFDPSDARLNYFQTGGGSISGFSGDYTLKWALQYKVIPVIRLAEMFLTRGEANRHVATTATSPADDINTVRERAGAPDIAAPTIQDFVDERFRELGYEGDRFFTLKRLKLPFDLGLGYDDDKLVLPIPQTEIDVNKNLQQNPGYF